MDNNCHIPDFVRAFSNAENGRLNLSLVRQSHQIPLYLQRCVSKMQT